MRTRLITDPDELDAVVAPYLARLGHGVPPRGCYVAAVALDEHGAIVGHQLLQNALFMEGMGASDPHVPLLTLHNMLADYAATQLHAPRLMTLTRRNRQGKKIGRCARKLGYERKYFDVYLRTL